MNLSNQIIQLTLIRKIDAKRQSDFPDQTDQTDQPKIIRSYEILSRFFSNLK
jgi:hypothetical protein